MLTKGVAYNVEREMGQLRERFGTVRTGVAAGQPKMETDIQVAEAIMYLSGTCNGHLATHGFKFLEKRTGHELHDPSAEHEGKQITFADTQAAPVPVITSPEWSGSETGGRRYSPFTINIERPKPFHTLTGRQQFYLDHDWMIGMGEAMPVYRPPLNMTKLFGESPVGTQSELGSRSATSRRTTSGRSTVSTRTTSSCSLARWPDDLDVRRGRRQDRGQGQRLDRGRQPQRRGRLPGHRVAPDAGGHGLHAPRAGPAHRRALTETDGKARRHPQLADAHPGQAQPHHRRLRPARLLLQLHRPDRQQPGRGHDDPQADCEGGVPTCASWPRWQW